jgi:hypothetical protein
MAVKGVKMKWIEQLETRSLLNATPAPIFNAMPGSTVVKSLKPSALNTGPRGARLKPMKGLTITTDGTVLKNVAIRGTIVIDAANVTIQNFRLNATGNNYGVQVINGGSVTLSNGEIFNAAGAAVIGNNWTALRLNVHTMASDAFDGGGNNTLEDCFIHNIGYAKGAHADGFQANNGDSIVIEGNNFNLPKSALPFRANSCIFLNGYVYNYLDGTVITGNWFDGGNYSIYALEQTNTTVTHNVFGRDYRYGILDGLVSDWSQNTDSKGATVLSIPTAAAFRASAEATDGAGPAFLPRGKYFHRNHEECVEYAPIQLAPARELLPHRVIRPAGQTPRESGRYRAAW